MGNDNKRFPHLLPYVLQHFHNLAATFTIQIPSWFIRKDNIGFCNQSAGNRYTLLLTAGEKPPFETLFSYFPYWKTIAVTMLLQAVYILLWTLLLIIPGIMASYSYAMTGYILAEHPELTAGEAIAQSKAMMAGNRWRLFCLQFSFIGWGILCALTLGIGNLALRPYRHAAEAAFYRELCGGTVPEDEEYSA